MARYIEIDEKKVKRLMRETQQFQDDITCAVGTDFIQKIAIAENKMIFDILKGLVTEPTEDVVPRSEVEELEYKLAGVMHSVDKWLEGDELKQDEVNRAMTMREKTLKLVENLEYKADFLEQSYNALEKEVEKAKQEIANQIFEEIEESIANLEYRANTPRKTIKVEELKAQVNWVLHEVVPATLTELKKKYIGENSNV